jgi:hypothetical protein
MARAFLAEEILNAGGIESERPQGDQRGSSGSAQGILYPVTGSAKQPVFMRLSFGIKDAPGTRPLIGATAALAQRGIEPSRLATGLFSIAYSQTDPGALTR